MAFQFFATAFPIELALFPLKYGLAQVRCQERLHAERKQAKGHELSHGMYQNGFNYNNDNNHNNRLKLVNIVASCWLCF